MRKNFIALMLIACSALSIVPIQPIQFIQTLQAQTKIGTTAAQFLGVGVGARAVAMGGAFVAVADDISSLYWNPAGLGRARRGEANFVHADWLVGTGIDWAGIGVPLGRYGALGASVFLLNSGDIERTTELQPDGTGEVFNTQDLAIQLTYAKALTDRFSIGGSFKYVQQRLYNVSASTIAFDVGLIFLTASNGLQLGATITNFGGKMQLNGKDLLTTVSSGTGQNGDNNGIPARLNTDEWAIPLSFRIGVAYPLLNAGNAGEHRLMIAADGISPSDNSTSLNVGGEYTWRNLLSLRGGYNSLFIQNAEASWTLGAGLEYDFGGVAVKFDYTYQAFGRLNAPQWISVGMEF